MSEVRVYILPMNDDLSYQADFIEVTRDITESALGTLKQETDFSDYEIGLFKFSNISLSLNNISGRYSEVGQPRSIFRGTRSDSIIRITWQIANDLTQCGNAICGNSYTNIEKTVFEGLIQDDATGFSIDNHEVKFRVLGFESLFEKETFDAQAAVNVDYLSDVLYINLNQPAITKVLTVDALNINVGSDYIINIETQFLDKKVTEILPEILFLTNSVLYIKDRTVYITPRTPSIDTKYYFYGHTSDLGNENIVTMNEIKSGTSKISNYLFFKNSSGSINQSLEDAQSVDLYGKRIKNFDYDSVESVINVNSILADILSEYAYPKTEIMLTTFLSYELLDLNFFDTIKIDYPTELYTEYGQEFALFGSATYGIDRYCYGKWHYVINTQQNFKILNRNIDLKNNLITFKIREY